MRKLLAFLLIGFAIVGCQKEDFSDELAETNEKLRALESTIETLVKRAEEDAELAILLKTKIATAEALIEEAQTEILRLSELIEGGNVRITELRQLLLENEAEADLIEIEIEKLQTLLNQEEITHTEYLDQIQTLEEELEVVRNTVIEVINEIEVEVIEYLDTVVIETVTEVVTNVIVETETVTVNVDVIETVTNTVEIDNIIINDVVVNETVVVTNVIITTDTVTIIEVVENVITEVNTVVVDNVIEETVTVNVTNTIIETVTNTIVVDDPDQVALIESLRTLIESLEFEVSQLRKDNMTDEGFPIFENLHTGDIVTIQDGTSPTVAFRYDPFVKALWVHSSYVGEPLTLYINGSERSMVNGKANLGNNNSVHIRVTQGDWTAIDITPTLKMNGTGEWMMYWEE